jgi:hypothetical protein
VTQLVVVLRDLMARRDAPDAGDVAARIDAVLHRSGGLEPALAACEEHLGNGPNDWRRFIQPHFRSKRRWL